MYYLRCRVTIQSSFLRLQLLWFEVGVEVPKGINSEYMSSQRGIQRWVGDQVVLEERYDAEYEADIDTAAAVAANSFAVD